MNQARGRFFTLRNLVEQSCPRPLERACISTFSTTIGLVVIASIILAGIAEKQHYILVFFFSIEFHPCLDLFS